MSKSLGNYIGVDEAPSEMFGKVMSISDELMWKYYTLLTDLSPTQLLERRRQVEAGGIHPKQAKIDLAKMIVTDFHGTEAAELAADEFERRFTKKEIATDALATFSVSLGAEGSRRIANVMVECRLASSASEATRKIEQGAVRLDGIRLTDARARVDGTTSDFTLQVGRNAVRVTVVT
jgi:tyrosyl-tRNA synthetase